MADNVTATGKYFLISVPEFADDPVGPRKGQKMTSFLRMGAFHETPETEDATKRAYELAKYAQVVSMIQGGHLTEPYGAEIDTGGTGVEGRGVFLDDHRNDDPAQLPVSERLAQSNALLTRGGWWDHSDGNRVTTTYGDKVEVIRGNYKMVVLHRQDDAAGAGGWDVSGGNIQDLGPNTMPGASIRVEFRPGMFGQRGTWHLENVTNNLIVTSDYAGDFFEHWYGNLKQSTVGSEAPVEWNAGKGKPGGNPHITEKTWAKQIDSYTGSSAWRIPLIQEETWAIETKDLTDVSGNTTSTTTVGGDVTETTTVGGAVTETTTVGGAITSTTTAGAITETTTSGAITSITTSGAITDVTTAGAITGVTTARAITDVTLAGNVTEVLVAGLHTSVELAAKVDVFIGGTFALDLGGQIDIALPDAWHMSYPNTTETNIKRLRASLQRTEMALQDQIIAVEERIAALQLYLGIV